MPRKLNPNQIENASVQAVISYFNFSETLAPNIPTMDKTPVWDGNLFLYKSYSDKQSKTGLIGTIPTQVKGRQFRDFSNSKIKHPIDVNDVSIYQKNGGIAYFVVYINADTEDTKIYYRLLAPIELRKIAKQAGKKKKTQIDFYELPQRDNVIELQFLDFYNDCLRQHSFANQNAVQIQDIDMSKASISVQFSSPSDNHFEVLKYLTTTPQFCYYSYNDDPTKTLHPIGEGRYNLTAQDTAEIPVTVGETQYYDDVRIEMINGKTNVVIADVWHIPFAESPDDIGKQHTQHITWNFKTLSQRMTFFEFILAAKQNGRFAVGNWNIKLNNMDKCEDIQRVLAADKNLQSILDRLNVTEELNLQNVTEQDVKNMNTLIDYYIFGKRLTSSNSAFHHLERIDINNIKLLFLVEKIQEPNYVKLHSIQDLSSFVFATKNDVGHHVLIPTFCMFNVETFQTVSNIAYSTFIEECEQTKSNDNRFYQCVNWSILRMLTAYDNQTEKKQILIETALSLNKWLIENDPDKNTTLLHKINQIQILKRMNRLTETDNDFLFETVDACGSNDVIKFACHTLLGHKDSAARYFNKLPAQIQNDFVSMPIYSLFKTMA